MWLDGLMRFHFAVGRVWARLTAHPAGARLTYWALFCLAGLIASTSAAAYLEETRGYGGIAMALSRILSGPSYCFDQYCYRLDWLIWEEIILYSTVQWTLTWLAGWPLAVRASGRSFRILIAVTLILLCVLGLFVADAPEDPLEIFDVFQTVIDY